LLSQQTSDIQSSDHIYLKSQSKLLSTNSEYSFTNPQAIWQKMTFSYPPSKSHSTV